MQLATSNKAQLVWQLVQDLQVKFQKLLQASDLQHRTHFSQINWLREEGLCGGGWRKVADDGGIFSRASINISQVQYEAMLQKPLVSATAFSTIIHPDSPLIPSTHMHFSWTEVRDGQSYWRVMADLNPSILNTEDRDLYLNAFRSLAPEVVDEGVKQGDKYFNIPELQRARGVAHFYLEQFHSDDFMKDMVFVRQFAEGMIGTYGTILQKGIAANLVANQEQKLQQLAYHSLYFFQVLMLDRGTTSGIIAHNQNDLGIMGSLPQVVDIKLLQSWSQLVVGVRKQLIEALVAVLPDDGSVLDPVKIKIAAIIREFYQKHPEAIREQASGFVIPPTIANHLGR